MNKKNKLVNALNGVVKEVSNLLASRSSLFTLRYPLLALPSSLFAPRSSLFALLLALLAATTVEAAHIKETLSLKNGWNGVYLESTPDEADCAQFFKGLPVTKVMLYDGKGRDGAPLIDETGRDILQSPVYYYIWNAAQPNAGTLKALVGGRSYLIFATNTVSKEFIGVPKQPVNFWRQTDASDSFQNLNLVGVSSIPNTNVTAAAYFGEGPTYDKDGKVYKVSGTNEEQPTMLPVLGSAPKVTHGVSYLLSSKGKAEWPGVISVRSSQVIIQGGSGSLEFSNSGTKERTFRLTMVESANPDEKLPPLIRESPVRENITDSPKSFDVVANEGWDVSVTTGGVCRITFKTKPSRMLVGVTYAAVLQIEDLNGTAMRVHVPVVVLDSAPAKNDFRGLWVGSMALGEVSSIDGKKEPLPAAGIMSLNVIVHVDSNSTARLLQRAVVAVDTNGNVKVGLDPNVQSPWSVERSFFTGMMSVDVPIVGETGEPGFGTTKGAVFVWGVPERARDNPFRHAWHPDHDGRSADYTMETPTGDDPANYQNPIKPELWSITNALSFKLDADYEANADELMDGNAIWDVSGLVSTNTIRSTGRFLFRRISKDVELEK